MIRFLCNIFIAFFLFVFVLPFVNFDLVSARENSSNKEAKKETPRDDGKANARNPILAVSPKEIDFGVIGPGEGIRGNFVLKNVGSGDVNWSVNGPEGWSFFDEKKVSCVLKNTPDNLKVHISFLKDSLSSGSLSVEGKNLIQLSFETGTQINVYRKYLPMGPHREMFKFTSNGGTKNVFIRFELGSGHSEPQIDVSPARIDFGVITPGEVITKRIKVANRGREVLRWQIADQEEGASPVMGRYISFQNDDNKGSGAYVPPFHLKDNLETTGKWFDSNGFPSSTVPSHTIRYRFVGTGVAVFFSMREDEGNVAAYVDDKHSNNTECREGQRLKTECMVAEDLPYGPHTITIVNKGGHVVVEGVRIYGKEVKRVNTGCISIFPDSGTTTKENDYVNIMLNTKKLDMAYYGENVIFHSNGGTAIIEASFEVSADNIPKIIDVYRYIRGYDYLYTSNPKTDVNMSRMRGYIKEGIAYRLFSHGTPGTTPFHRWYSNEKRDHFYSHDTHGEGKSLKGYSYEGYIGNIATSRLTNTRELYRWFNPSTGRHFYSTDPNGEDIIKKGYRFDGIAGYVK